MRKKWRSNSRYSLYSTTIVNCCWWILLYFCLWKKPKKWAVVSCGFRFILLIRDVYGMCPQRRDNQMKEINISRRQKPHEIFLGWKRISSSWICKWELRSETECRWRYGPKSWTCPSARHTLEIYCSSLSAILNMRSCDIAYILENVCDEAAKQKKLRFFLFIFIAIQSLPSCHTAQAITSQFFNLSRQEIKIRKESACRLSQ